MPCDWQPLTVVNPDSDLPFTEERAWHYIAELAESGHAIQQIVMKQPPGDRGYVMVVSLHSNSPDLYIKVQVKGGRIFGRSFHLSTS
jgi:hypothetical protein